MKKILTIQLLIFLLSSFLYSQNGKPDSTELNEPTSPVQQPDESPKTEEQEETKEKLSKLEKRIASLSRDIESIKNPVDTSKFTLSLGSNFNFLDGLKLDDFYGDLDVNFFNYWKPFKNCQKLPLLSKLEFGFHLTVYQGKSFTYGDTLPYIQTTNRLVEDTLFTSTSFNRVNEKIVSENLGLNVGFSMKLFNDNFYDPAVGSIGCESVSKFNIQITSRLFNCFIRIKKNRGLSKEISQMAPTRLRNTGMGKTGCQIFSPTQRQTKHTV